MAVDEVTLGGLLNTDSRDFDFDVAERVFANGAFVAVGDDGTVLRSVDGGQSWTLSATPGSADLSSIAYGSGVFVAVGGTSVYTSPDGAAWKTLFECDYQRA